MLRCVIAVDQDDNMAINDEMPWGRKPLPEDGAMFTMLTKGHDILMGRRTWESLPDKIQKSKDRAWWVATSSSKQLVSEAYMTRCTDTRIWCKVSSNAKNTCCIIGGPSLLEGVHKFVDELWLTVVQCWRPARAWDYCSKIPKELRTGMKRVCAIQLSERCELQKWIRK